MSGANAVSGITWSARSSSRAPGDGWISSALGFLAIVCAMMNVVGGYAVTDRMLEMFRRRARRPASTRDGEPRCPRVEQLLYLAPRSCFIVGLSGSAARRPRGAGTGSPARAC
jgi:hypothetical protein